MQPAGREKVAHGVSHGKESKGTASPGTGRKGPARPYALAGLGLSGLRAPRLTPWTMVFRPAGRAEHPRVAPTLGILAPGEDSATSPLLCRAPVHAVHAVHAGAIRDRRPLCYPKNSKTLARLGTGEVRIRFSKDGQHLLRAQAGASDGTTHGIQPEA